MATKTIRCVISILICGALSPALPAATVELPLSLDYRIVEEALVEQVFAGPDRTAEMFADSIRCNTLVLSNPRVSGDRKGRIRLVTDMEARIGTPLGDKCRFATTWQGVVETEQTARVAAGTARVSFQVVESRLLRSGGGKSVLPGFTQNWIRDYVHPRLGAVTIDLTPAVGGIEELMRLALDTGQGASQVRITGVVPSADSLAVTLSLDVPDAPPDWAPGAAPPLTEQELAAWDENWQAWDAFATWMILTLAEPGDAEFRRALADTLLEARYELRDALAQDDRARDPVRELFLNTWTRLAPLLHDRDLPVPGGTALQFAVFLSAGDALEALDELAPHLGLSINKGSLRSLARTLVPAVGDAELSYDLAVDPDLRDLLGMGPALEAMPPDGEEGIPAWLLNKLIASAEAAQIDPRLVQRLNTWVPRRAEVENYLHTMARLLDAVSDAEHENGKIPQPFLGIYDPLLRATAWQESCWRQFIQRNGALETIRSSAGSVGLMQINMHVWRGIYDRNLILSDVAYNARAGNEILVHYLVDYAIRKGEHEVTGNPDNLARSAYALYNGGPRHLKRYREAGTSPSLRKIDQAFFEKYQAIQTEGSLAVKGCLAGG
ncbi:MAG: lytic transglycosylase domain-containing protein [Xanthomonadales bacterium]|nr:lytic transglycosylase domain-containing protein [Xanthomonadales bacterium]